MSLLLPLLWWSFSISQAVLGYVYFNTVWNWNWFLSVIATVIIFSHPVITGIVLYFAAQDVLRWSSLPSMLIAGGDYLVVFLFAIYVGNDAKAANESKDRVA